ncbi:MAG: B12-binding domain-containing radical SAM protein [Bacteroidetes bacterium]|nr:B12-binding domain-containing radical SAM protein [Bacteroidota bacterium]
MLQPPLSYVYIAGILREEGHDVRFLDCNSYDLGFDAVDAALRGFKPDVMLFRSTPSTFFYDCRVAGIAKKHGANTVMLNWNLNAFSKQALEKVPDLDVYVTAYSYENILPRLFGNGDLADLPGVTYREDGETIVNPEGRKTKVGDIPPPPWGILPDHSVFYTRVKSISPWAVCRASKGCGYVCQVCSDSFIPWDPRRPKLVGLELEELVEGHGAKYLSFFDNTFTLNSGWVKEVCSEIEGRDLDFKWFINTRPELLNEDLIEAMKHAGLDGVSLGLETGSDETLRGINKGFTLEQGESAVKMLRKAGVKTYISMMMGLPGETEEQMWMTYKHILKVKANGFQISIVAPYPHTPLYRDCLEKGLIDEGLEWDELCCVPRGLPGDLSLSQLGNSELLALRRKFYRKIYFHPRYLLPNMWWVAMHPADLRMAVDHFIENMRRLAKKVTFSH